MDIVSIILTSIVLIALLCLIYLINVKSKEIVTALNNIYNRVTKSNIFVKRVNIDEPSGWD